MAQAQSQSRPTSPHLSQWRWHITMLVSILTRVTGIILYVAVIALVVWLCAVAAGPDAYGALMSWLPGWALEALIYLGVAALAYHALAGVRHFAFDIGWGFTPKTANATAWLAIVLTFAAPAGLYFLIHH